MTLMSRITEAPVYMKGVGAILVFISMFTVVNLFIGVNGLMEALKQMFDSPLVFLLIAAALDLIMICFVYGVVAGDAISWTFCLVITIINTLLDIVGLEDFWDFCVLAATLVGLALLLAKRTRRYCWGYDEPEGEVPA